MTEQKIETASGRTRNARVKIGIAGVLHVLHASVFMGRFELERRVADSPRDCFQKEEKPSLSVFALPGYSARLRGLAGRLDF